MCSRSLQRDQQSFKASQRSCSRSEDMDRFSVGRGVWRLHHLLLRVFFPTSQRANDRGSICWKSKTLSERCGGGGKMCGKMVFVRSQQRIATRNYPVFKIVSGIFTSQENLILHSRFPHSGEPVLPGRSEHHVKSCLECSCKVITRFHPEIINMSTTCST